MRCLLVYDLNELYRAQSWSSEMSGMLGNVNLLHGTFRWNLQIFSPVLAVGEIGLLKFETRLFLLCLFIFVVREWYRFRSFLQNADPVQKIHGRRKKHISKLTRAQCHICPIKHGISVLLFKDAWKDLGFTASWWVLCGGSARRKCTFPCRDAPTTSIVSSKYWRRTYRIWQYFVVAFFKIVVRRSALNTPTLREVRPEYSYFKGGPSGAWVFVAPLTIPWRRCGNCYVAS